MFIYASTNKLGFYKYIINQIRCEKVINKNNKQQKLTLEWVENKF